MVSGMMIRRTHADTVLGAPLVVLPKHNQKTITMAFNKVEREIYETVRMRCVRAINTIAKNGQIDRHLKVVIFMLQRLRQMDAHIFQVQELIEKEYETDKIEYLWNDVTTELRTNGGEQHA